MDAEHIAIAKACLAAAHDGSLGFPEIVGRLIAAGFEGYTVDYRRNSQTFYLADGDGVVLEMPPSAGRVASAFDAVAVERLVRWAQASQPDYSYVAFSEKVKAAGITRTALILVGRVLAADDFTDSRLYAADHHHVLRPRAE